MLALLPSSSVRMSPDLLARLRANRWVDPVRKCWLWTGGSNRHRYGLTWVDDRVQRVHRLAYLHWHGPIPAGLYVMHSCDNRECWNPDHLSLGTAADNNADKVRKGRHAHGHTGGGRRLLTADVVREIRASSDTADALARRLGCSSATVLRARRGDTWAHVPGAVARRPHRPLTADAVREIRSSSCSSSALARRFGVAINTVRDVRIGHSWREVV